MPLFPFSRHAETSSHRSISDWLALDGAKQVRTFGEDAPVKSTHLHDVCFYL